MCMYVCGGVTCVIYRYKYVGLLGSTDTYVSTATCLCPDVNAHPVRSPHAAGPSPQSDTLLPTLVPEAAPRCFPSLRLCPRAACWGCRSGSLATRNNPAWVSSALGQACPRQSPVSRSSACTFRSCDCSRLVARPRVCSSGMTSPGTWARRRDCLSRPRRSGRTEGAGAAQGGGTGEASELSVPTRCH